MLLDIHVLSTKQDSTTAFCNIIQRHQWPLIWAEKMQVTEGAIMVA